ncbi:hypothetical protein LOTGIDRAFT_118224 [Lottia gigantea]|uniref:DNA-directed RNA polymerase III subunit RPC9 n=1 Tax=Lottia gigantea TaxID=225164 RepID=V4ACE3_LOTGI|nr:hypothetical protein LOTGIDRAFT_118224 [Lottia gigantea]ESO94502.1 hypothetical protein LOTGIDRAFT_118224 [Lottia gigantea]
MEVISENSALLTNYEVFSLLTDIQNGHGQRKPNKHQQNLATIVYETVKYLENTSCKLQNPELLKVFAEKVSRFNLTKAEKLQILNQRPTTAVEIQLIVEESEERLTEEEIYELLELISSCVPSISDGEKVEGASEDHEGKEEIQEGNEEEEEEEQMDEGEGEVHEELITEDRNDVQVGAEDNDDDD